nr:hypothetical protein [Glycomyces arizonensis]
MGYLMSVAVISPARPPHRVHPDEIGHRLAQGGGVLIDAPERGLGAGVLEDAGGYRVAFGVVGVEQRLGGPAVDDCGEFPAQVDHVLHAGAQALAACREVEVCGVAGEEDSAVPVAVGLAGCVTVAREPARGVHAEVRSDDLAEGGAEGFEGHRFVPVGDVVELVGDDAVPVGAEREYGEVAVLAAFLEDVVIGRVGEVDVAEHGGHGCRGAGEGDAGEAAHSAAAAVAADEVLRAQARSVSEFDGDAGRVLFEPLEFGTKSDHRSGLGRVLGEQILHFGLHDDEQVRVARRSIGEVERERGVVRARSRAALREEAVEQSALVEDFERADMQAARARFGGAWLGLAFEDLHVDSGES